MKMASDARAQKQFTRYSEKTLESLLKIQTELAILKTCHLNPESEFSTHGMKEVLDNLVDDVALIKKEMRK